MFPIACKSLISFDLQLFQLNADNSVVVALIYHPPKSTKEFNQFIDEFAKLLSRFITNYDRLLILGDFNIHVCFGNFMSGGIIHPLQVKTWGLNSFLSLVFAKSSTCLLNAFFVLDLCVIWYNTLNSSEWNIFVHLLLRLLKVCGENVGCYGSWQNQHGPGGESVGVDCWWRPQLPTR